MMNKKENNKMKNKMNKYKDQELRQGMLRVLIQEEYKEIFIMINRLIIRVIILNRLIVMDI